MDVSKEKANDNTDKQTDEDEAIDRAFLQMELIYKSRCVQPPRGSNVTIREVKKDQ